MSAVNYYQAKRGEKEPGSFSRASAERKRLAYISSDPALYADANSVTLVLLELRGRGGSFPKLAKLANEN